jgi:hypothetical protein
MQNNDTHIQKIIRDDVTRTDTQTVDANGVIRVILRHFPMTSADEARSMMLMMVSRLGYNPVWL